MSPTTPDLDTTLPTGGLVRGFLSLGLVCGLAVLVGCAPPGEPDGEKATDAPPVITFTKTQYADLPGWSSDDPTGAARAFKRSCDRFARQTDDTQIGPDGRYGTVGAWKPVCAAVAGAQGADAIRAAFAAALTPWAITDDDPSDDLFTGYYEPELNGAKTRSETYIEPLYPRPKDLILVDLGNWRDTMRGERIAGRVVDGRLKPYDSRAEIDGGSLKGTTKPIVWLDSPVDAFFLHIQGSGLVKLPDGSLTRVGYDGHNGHIYHAVGRTLIEWGEVKREDMSLQAIRSWMAQNPDRMRELMHKNPSYIFFRELTGDGPIGAQSVALTPGRSLAIDRRFLPLGAPMMVDVDYADESGAPLNRLVIAQDTGGAIRGAVRADMFWGAGAPAERLAGPMAAKGRYWILLPNGVDPRTPSN